MQELFYSFLKYFCHQGFALTRLYLRYRIIFFLASVFLLFSKESVSDHNNRDDLINLHYFLAFGNTF
ncbi:hypothetical protein LBJG_00020 [Lactobacillus jensenii 1153]|nr:hypothetical protein LBJG_00020 [Lactobacillus jensenii 1153]